MEYWAELNKSDVIEYLQEDQTKITRYLDSKSNKEVWCYLIVKTWITVFLSKINTTLTLQP